MKLKNALLILFITTLYSCDDDKDDYYYGYDDDIVTVQISASSNEVKVGSKVTLSWSTSNAYSCSASGDWTGLKATLGNEDLTIKEGDNIFNLTCTGDDRRTGNASVKVVGLVQAVDITNKIFFNRNSDCVNYKESYSSKVRDLKRVLDFDGNVDIEAFDTYCDISSDNIPNHDFNDDTANFRTDVTEINRVFRVKRNPQQASQISEINAQSWDAIMLNGVVVDMKSAGCYKPSDPRADTDGNTEAGCNENDEWMLIPLEYSTKFGADQHNAHVQPDGTYHYHGNPNAMFDDRPSDLGSPVIGFAADGFPIFGSYIMDETTGNYRKVNSGYTVKQGSRGERSDTNPGGDYTGLYEQDWEWTDAGDLDECNGMVYKGEYGYYVTDTYPYILNCFKGTPDTSFNK